jgi:hypothetical protein
MIFMVDPIEPPPELISLLSSLRARGVHAEDCCPVGSRRTCNPPPTDTDDDWLLSFKDHNAYPVIATLLDMEWSGCGDREYLATQCGHCRAWRKGDVNIILAFDHLWFDKFILSTRIAKNLNLMDKADRITLFKTVRGEI